MRVQSMVAEKAWQSEWHVVVLVGGGLSCLGTTDRTEGKPGYKIPKLLPSMRLHLLKVLQSPSSAIS